MTRWDERGDQLHIRNKGAVGFRLDSSTGVGVEVNLVNINVHPGPNPAEPDGVSFSVLLDRLVETLDDVAKCLLTDRERHMNRFGLVAEAQMKRTGVPPGVERWVKSMGAFWPRGVLLFDGQVSAVIEERAGIVERCHHRLSWPADEAEDVSLRLDWQKIYDPSLPLKSTELMAETDRCVKQALKYFERFARGLDVDGIAEGA